MVAMATYGKWEKWILTISAVSLEIFFHRYVYWKVLQVLYDFRSNRFI